MKRVIWKDPNYHATITDTQDRVSEELHAAGSQTEVEARLQHRIDAGFIRSFVVKPYDFSKWKKRAADATAAAIAAKVVDRDYQVSHDPQARKALEARMQHFVADALMRIFAVDPADTALWEQRAADATKAAVAAKEAGEKFDFKSAVWSDLKDYLCVLFHGKCAYCDGKFDRNDWGDVEHYRPKRKVTDKDNVALDHPGYYWLAYQTTNLLPSCKLCNQGKGKANQFPIDAAGIRVAEPAGDLAAEKPLLLNAYTHDPVEHLKYVAGIVAGAVDKSLGTVGSLDQLGEVSTNIYWLNRPTLIEYRRKLQGDVRQRVRMAFVEEKPEVINDLIARCYEGIEEFSGSVYAEVMSYLDKMEKGLNRSPD